MPEMSYCFKCNRIKLPRAHHCKQCQRCVLRMDHHCPWVGHCVGLHNQKYFTGFLAWGILTCLSVIISEMWFYFIGDSAFLAVIDKGTALSIQINCMTCIGLMTAVAYLFGFQLYIGAKNLTTVENHIKGIHERVSQNRSVLISRTLMIKKML